MPVIQAQILRLTDVEVQTEAKGRELTIHLDSKERVDDFKKLITRAMNTWENAPNWLWKMADHIEGTPTPAGRAVPKETNAQPTH